MKIELRDAGTGRRTEWQGARLSESGPDDAVFEFDVVTERVTFGNRVNGRIPPQGVEVLATYAVSAGEVLPPRRLAAQRPVFRKHLTQIIAVLALTSNSSAAGS